MPVLSKENIKRAYHFMKRNGVVNTYYAAKEEILEGRKAPYEPYVLSDDERERQRRWADANDSIKFSIVVPAYNTPKYFLKELLKSVLGQTYFNLELVIVDASVDDIVKRELEYCLKSFPEEMHGERVRYIHISKNGGISENTNEGILEAKGEYIGLLDHDDLLTEDALYEVARAIYAGKYEEEGGSNDKLFSRTNIVHGRPKMVYSDEDKCNENGTVFTEPHYKLDFNPDYILSNNYVCHFTVVEADLIKNLLLRKEFDGAQDFDLVLRVWMADDRPIVHIPKVLYHWRCHSNSTAGNPQSKEYAYEAGRRAVQAAVDSLGWDAEAVGIRHLGFYRLEYKSDPFEFRDKLGAIGGRILKKSTSGKIIGGAMDITGAGYYFGMPAAYSGYMHRAVLSQQVEALDLRCLRLRKELWPLFEEVTGLRYKETHATCRPDSNASVHQWDRIFDYRTLPKDCDIPCLSYDLSEAIIAAGYTLLYQPEWETVWKK
ncbi:MAG: glycosyltransferase [Lachnospiraceae bacterium]|nr:glycosyltransferase [Lachnospiraceae bacterium]